MADDYSVESSSNEVPEKLANSFLEFSKKTGSDIKAELVEDVTVEMCESALRSSKPHCSEYELETKYRNLVSEFRMSISHDGEDIRILKAKLLEIVTRSRQTREACLVAQDEASKCKKMTDMVVCHLEKLVNHIKRESQLKAKHDEEFKNTTEMLRKLKQNYTILLSQNASKNKYISALQKGNGLLQDQLKLMDEKYLQLRFKLDHAREHGVRAQRKADAKLGKAMEKFAEVAAQNGINMHTIDFSSGSTVGASHMGPSDGFESGSVVSGLTRATVGSGLPATPIKRAQTAPD